MICKKCGTGNPEGAIFCLECGAKLEDQTYVPSWLQGAPDAVEEVATALPEPEAKEEPKEEPVVETLESKPEVEAPKVEAPEVEPEVEIPEVKEPEVKEPEVEIPEVKAPEAEVPEVEVPAVEVPEEEVPAVEVPEVEAPEVEVSEVEAPEAEEPQAEPEPKKVDAQQAQKDAKLAEAVAKGQKKKKRGKVVIVVLIILVLLLLCCAGLLTGVVRMLYEDGVLDGILPSNIAQTTASTLPTWDEPTTDETSSSEIPVTITAPETSATATAGDTKTTIAEYDLNRYPLPATVHNDEFLMVNDHYLFTIYPYDTVYGSENCDYTLYHDYSYGSEVIDSGNVSKYVGKDAISNIIYSGTINDKFDLDRLNQMIEFDDEDSPYYYEKFVVYEFYSYMEYGNQMGNLKNYNLYVFFGFEDPTTGTVVLANPYTEEKMQGAHLTEDDAEAKFYIESENPYKY